MYRLGLYCKKLGCTTLYGENGARDCVTLLYLESAQILEVIKINNWNMVRVGFGNAKTKHLGKSVVGIFQKLSMPLKRKIVSFKTKLSDVRIGEELTVDYFSPNQYVDVTGYSIGKGFAGAMKRHGFGGLAASHGVSISHRSHGSVGCCQDPGHIIKGKKMAGHMGTTKVTIQNLRILSIDNENNLIAIKGAVPGAKNSYVIIRDALKKRKLVI